MFEELPDVPPAIWLIASEVGLCNARHSGGPKYNRIAGAYPFGPPMRKWRRSAPTSLQLLITHLCRPTLQ